MMRVLVSGATGFIGRIAAAELAARGFEVHGTSRRLAHKPKLAGSIALHSVDLLNISAGIALVKALRPTHLVLSAWTTKPGEFWADPRNEVWATSAIELAQAFFSVGGRRAVLVGSCAEYDWNDPALPRAPIREDDAQGLPQTLYGRTKRRAAEGIAKAATEVRGEFAVGRIFFPMGPGEHRLRFLPAIISALLAGQPAELGPGDLVRDIIDVRDAGKALAEIVASNVIGPVNVGSGTGVRLGDVAHRVGAIFGRPDLIRLGALPARAGEPHLLVADIARLRQEVGFQSRFMLDDTISAALSYWRAHEHV